MKRVALAAALAASVAAVAAGIGSSASFDDTGPCPTIGPFFTCPTGAVGQPYSVQVKGKQGCDDYWFEVLSGSFPPGLSLSRSGLISGLPTTSGRFDFYLQIHDVTAAEGGPDWCTYDDRSQKQFVININSASGPPPPAAPPPSPLHLDTTSVPPATVSTPYNAQLSATPTGAHTWKITDGTLPPGTALGSSNGLISGTPTTAGSFRFTITVGDSSGRSARREFTIDVADPLTIAPLDVQGEEGGRAELGIPMSGKLGATGGNGNFTWKVAAGLLPTGLALAPDGTISGTPTIATRYGFTVQVADSDGRTASLPIKLTVKRTLTFKTLKLRRTRVGFLYTAKVTTLGGVAPMQWAISSGKLPRGFHLDKQLGVLSGRTQRAGTYRFSLLVADALGVTATKTFVLVVKA
jgi:large repetitive protein